MHKLFIVRHGNTFGPGEAPRRVGKSTDLPLVASGLAQADALGRHFGSLGVNFESVWCSPLLRTRQTAVALLAHLDAVPPIQDDGLLIEVDHGPDENRPESEVVARLGKSVLDAWEEQAREPPGWTVDGHVRLAGWRTRLAELADTEPGHSLCVTSNGAARFALIASDLRPMAGLKLATGAYGVLACNRGQTGALEVRLESWNVKPPA